jgi:hypothetical protein
LNGFLSEIIDAADEQVAFFLPTAGSFGEIFSYLWETLLETDLLEKGENVERLISEIPTIEDVMESAQKHGLKKMENSTSIEIFEFKDGAEFVNSPLMSDLLFPFWLEFLTDKEKKK